MPSLFGKKEDGVTEEQATQLAELQKQVADQASVITELTDYKTKNEQLKTLSAKSVELGYTGNVEKLLTDSKHDMGDAMSALITAFSVETTERTETFVDSSADEDNGDAGEDGDAVTPKTRTEAINYVRANTDLTGKAANLHAAELYPKLWGDA